MRVQAAPVEAELLPGASERDWLLVIEADGLHRDEDLNLQPLLRQFAVGRVSIQRISAQSRSLTRWQIPLHLLDTSPRQVPSLPLGADLTPSLAVPTRSLDGTLMPTQDPVFSPVELQARVIHEGNLYPGQPFIYELTLWLPANLEAPNLGEPITPAFTIRRLGEDRWDSPASPGLPGRLTRKWLLQAKGPGLHPVESPRFQGRLPPQDQAGATAPGNAGDLLSARAATLFIKVDKAPLEPVASSLVLRQQFSPAQARVGEPVIRTLTLVMEGGDGNRLPAHPLVFTARESATPASPAPGVQYLYWVLLAILLRAFMRRWPRWRAFYRLQRALATGSPDEARETLLTWAVLRWDTPCLHLARLPCHRDPAMGALLDGLDRACFSPKRVPGEHLPRQALARELCTWESFAIAYGLRILAWMRA
uniref:hypothetical protein n=1 Tax=Aeromonas caviae TaxID=648 RepID=UPI001CC6D094|nr:hypothetical protein [Aeromonas caviae]